MKLTFLMASGTRRCRIQELLLLGLLSVGCGDGCLCCDSDDDDDGGADDGGMSCGVSSADDDCGWSGCPPEDDGEMLPDPPPVVPPPADPDWEQCSLSELQKSEVLRLAGAVIRSTDQIRVAAQARDALVWQGTAALRRSLVAPDDELGPGGDTDTDGSDTDGGSTGISGVGTTSSGTSEAGTTSGDSGDGTSTGGEDEPPSPAETWVFDDAGYSYLAEPLTFDVAMVAREGLPFAEPGDPLDLDLREPGSYFNVYAFVPNEPAPWPDDLPLSGDMTFESQAPYAPLLGLDPELDSPHSIERDAFLDLSEVLTSLAFLPLRQVDANGVLEVSSVSGDVTTSLRAEGNDASLFVVLTGAATPWTPTSFVAESPGTGQRGVLQSAALWYRSAGYTEVEVPDEPSFDTGVLYGDLVLKVRADGFDYDLALEFSPDGAPPDLTVRCY